jgi:nucleoside-diphosphate-sugar epimerase
MHILILGGGGMVGRKLAERLAREGALGGRAISKLSLRGPHPDLRLRGAGRS